MIRNLKNVLGMFALLSLSAGSYADNLFDLTVQSVTNGFGAVIPDQLQLNIVARKSVSITDIVLNEGNCTVRGTVESVYDTLYDGAEPKEAFPLTMGMGDGEELFIYCENLIQAEFQTTRGNIVYEFSY